MLEIFQHGKTKLRFLLILTENASHEKRSCLTRTNFNTNTNSYSRIKINPTSDNPARGRVYVMGDGDAPRNPDVVTGTFLINQHSARVLFDSGADKSFVATTFASLLGIAPTKLDTTYEIEIANGTLIGTSTVLLGCTITLQNQPFLINLMPIQLGSFDVIVGMNWLSKHRARIVCDEKTIHIPLEGKTLVVQGNRSKSRFGIISFLRT